ncbi:MAG: hypothetical protein A2285_07385 [Elusimicrobia bacterium RIFOXYA12_FULL_57_11]|nr:MAG: hypothetical protein A2285_07385 [Elusimicrobia bacterium RIFOXYA12_FULL_57_11]
MPGTRLKLAAAVLSVLIAAAGAFTLYEYKAISARITRAVNGEAGKKLGRQVKFGAIKFSLFDGVVITDVCVSRRPDFSKGSFFCAQKVMVRPRLASLLRNKLFFSKIALDKPVLKVREEGGVWDFSDLLALLPETGKGLHLTWNASELTMKDAVLEADLQTSGLSFALENASLNLGHFSVFGGNYGLEASGLVKSALKGKLLSADVKIKAEANFDYGGLASTEGAFTAAAVSYGAITLESLQAQWKFFNLRKALAERNLSANLRAEKLLVPGRENSIRNSVAQGLDLFSSAMGRPAPRIEDIEMASLAAAFRLDDSVLSVRDIALRTNFLALDAGISIYGPAGTADAFLDADIGPSKLKMSASGPMSAPEIKPLLSATLSRKFKKSLAEIEASLLTLFPVTLPGE